MYMEVCENLRSFFGTSVILPQHQNFVIKIALTQKSERVSGLIDLMSGLLIAAHLCGDTDFFKKKKKNKKNSPKVKKHENLDAFVIT